MSHTVDLRQVIELVSNQKGLDRDVVFNAVEESLKSIIVNQLGEEDADVSVLIDRDTGQFQAMRYWLVVDVPAEEDLEHPDCEIRLVDAKKKDAELEQGDKLEKFLGDAVQLSRISAHQAKQVMVRIMRQAERDKILSFYRKRIGELIISSVKRMTRDGAILDLGDNAEALLPKEAMLPREIIRLNDHVRCYICDVLPDQRGPQVLVSRSDPGMLVALFELEIPEISEGIIEIKAAARDPGFRAKIAVKTNDGRIDPIGACVGIKGTRVQAVSTELNGERIDIILWDANPAQLVIHAMAPVEIVSIIVDEEKKSMDITVADEDLSRAIGRDGQNIRLVSELTGWYLNVLSVKEAEEKEAEQAEGGSDPSMEVSSEIPTETSTEVSRDAKVQNEITQRLEVDPEIATILLREGFDSIESVAHGSLETLSSIEEFDTDIATALQERAKDCLLTQAIVGTDEDGGDVSNEANDEKT